MSGWKDWAIGEVVTESDFQSFVQDQVVQVYDDSTDRDNTLGTAVAEGMVAYLKDTNQTQAYDGTAWVNVGEAGDITAVTAGTALTGGGTAGDVTLDVDISALATAHAGNALNANGELLDVDESAITVAQSQVTDLVSDLADKADNADFTGGTAGYTALSNGTAGLSYQPVSHNYIINGAFDIWQRGETFTDTLSSGALIGPDRWSIYDGETDRTLSKQSTNDTTNLPDIQNCIRWQRDSGSTNAVIAYLNQGLETANSIPLVGKSVSLSFWARAGADWSQSDDILGVQLRSGTGTDERPWNGYTGQVLVINTGVSLTTTWQRFTLTGTVDSTAKELALWFYWTPTGTAGANDYVEITGVQLEAGSVATPFKRNANSIQGELAACQRYFQKSYKQADEPGTITDDGEKEWLESSTGTFYRLSVTLQSSMRSAPTIKIYSPDTGAVGKIYNNTGGNDVNAFSKSISESGFIGLVNNVSLGNVYLAFQYTAESEL